MRLLSIHPRLTPQLCSLEVDHPDFAAGFTLLTLTALEAAYRGDLDIEWRTEFIGSQSFPATDLWASLDLPPVAAVLVGMDTHEWEPYAAAGDWRRALDAWEFDYAALLDYYFRHYGGGGSERRAGGEHVLGMASMMRAGMTAPPHYWRLPKAGTRPVV